VVISGVGYFTVTMYSVILHGTFCLIFVTSRWLLETGMKIDSKYEKDAL